MQNLFLHHVGIIVENEEKANQFMELFGLQEEYRGYVKEYECLCIFTTGNKGSQLEFVIPHGGNLANYNYGKGGIHHIAFKVNNIKVIQEEMSKKGITPLEKAAVKGAGDFVVNFIRPRDTGGILVEVVEEIEKTP